ncbi:hypothetical protein BD289DRAFT_485735 [Coniella lustricola]|uniref:Uncharacterized protein n=1 Tax=Coniella lustricola TaxID=2025994 RepID=A0A2T2ZXL4_9PEZI|nr:hypothetical protein BD289DRAFT_485735 [Coniella lustricola]
MGRCKSELCLLALSIHVKARRYAGNAANATSTHVSKIGPDSTERSCAAARPSTTSRRSAVFTSAQQPQTAKNTANVHGPKAGNTGAADPAVVIQFIIFSTRQLGNSTLRIHSFAVQDAATVQQLDEDEARLFSCLI